MYATLSKAENDFLMHMMRWGSDGWPVQKVGSRWIWADFWGVKGAPTTYRTKRECSADIKAYIAELIERSAPRKAAA